MSRTSLCGWNACLHKRYYIPAVAIVLLFFLLSSRAPPSRSGRFGLKLSSHTLPRDQAANSTLGFQKLLSLSRGTSWRTRGLKAAAEIVGLDFTYPRQPHNPPDLVRAFEGIGKERGAKRPSFGSAAAWLAHIDMLKYVIANDLTTALIVEDDVDFDVELKAQVKLVSDNVRTFTRVPTVDTTPYGTNWDVLWLGHCGTTMDQNTPGPRYPDPTRCKTDLYSGWSKHYLRDGLEEDHRIIQWSGRVTVCTFAYGVHRGSAQKILDIVASGADEAFDVALSHACASRVLKCLVVNPQIMNHYEPSKNTGYRSPVQAGNGKGKSSDEVDFETVKGTTGNIANSARCKALFNDVCMRTPSEL